MFQCIPRNIIYSCNILYLRPTKGSVRDACTTRHVVTYSIQMSGITRTKYIKRMHTQSCPMSTLPFWLTFGSIEIADYVDTCTFLQNEVYMSFLLRTFFDLTSSLSLSQINGCRFFFDNCMLLSSSYKMIFVLSSVKCIIICLYMYVFIELNKKSYYSQYTV